MNKIYTVLVLVKVVNLLLINLHQNYVQTVLGHEEEELRSHLGLLEKQARLAQLVERNVLKFMFVGSRGP